MVSKLQRRLLSAFFYLIQEISMPKITDALGNNAINNGKNINIECRIKYLVLFVYTFIHYFLASFLSSNSSGNSLLLKRVCGRQYYVSIFLSVSLETEKEDFMPRIRNHFVAHITFFNI